MTDTTASTAPPAGAGRLIDYKFDTAGVFTFRVRTADGAAAAQRYAGALHEIYVTASGEGTETDPDVPDGTLYQPAVVAPRGRAYLVDAVTAAGQEPDLPYEVYDPLIPEPLTDGARDELRGVLAEAVTALEADDADGEHDTLLSAGETIARILGVGFNPRSPHGM